MPAGFLEGIGRVTVLKKRDRILVGFTKGTFARVVRPGTGSLLWAMTHDNNQFMANTRLDMEIVEMVVKFAAATHGLRAELRMEEKDFVTYELI